jgi:large subunit ribosomal protein L9
MAKTEVILTSNIVGLGAESDQVKVAAGYARNYLFPQGLATPLTAANKRRLEVLRQRRAEREAHDLNTMTELAKSLQKLVCLIKVKTGDDGKMFGTVTSGMIADELKTQFDISLDKRKIHLEHPIRALGDYEIELHLHADVKGTLKLHVESTTPLPEPPAAPAEAAKPEEAKEGRPPRPERRGRRPPRRVEPGKVAETAEKALGVERTAKTEKPAKAEKPSRAERAPKSDKPPGAEKADGSEKAEKAG